MSDIEACNLGHQTTEFTHWEDELLGFLGNLLSSTPKLVSKCFLFWQLGA